MPTPVRVSEEQARLLFGDRITSPAPTKGTPKPARVKKLKSELPENILEAQIKGLLEARGWTCTRNQVGTYTPYRVLMALEEKTMTIEQAKRNIVRIGEKGTPDWRAERVVKVPGIVGAMQVFLWEAKAPGKKPSPEQRAVIERYRLLGWEVEWFDNFNSGGPLSFVGWYRARFGE